MADPLAPHRAEALPCETRRSPAGLAHDVLLVSFQCSRSKHGLEHVATIVRITRDRGERMAQDLRRHAGMVNPVINDDATVVGEEHGARAHRRVELVDFAQRLVRHALGREGEELHVPVRLLVDTHPYGPTVHPNDPIPVVVDVDVVFLVCQFQAMPGMGPKRLKLCFTHSDQLLSVPNLTGGSEGFGVSDHTMLWSYRPA